MEASHSVIDAPGLPKMDDGSPSARDLQIYELIVQGSSTRQIGKKFGITAGRVSQICHAVDEYLRPILMERIRGIKTRHTARLEFIYQQAMKAWRTSKKLRTIVVETERSTTAGQFPGETSVSQRTKEEQVGSVAFLTEARGALRQIENLWGIDKLPPVEPKKPDELTDFSFAGKKREDALRLYKQLMIKKLQRELSEMDNKKTIPPIAN